MGSTSFMKPGMHLLAFRSPERFLAHKRLVIALVALLALSACALPATEPVATENGLALQPKMDEAILVVRASQPVHGVTLFPGVLCQESFGLKLAEGQLDGVYQKFNYVTVKVPAEGRAYALTRVSEIGGYWSWQQDKLNPAVVITPGKIIYLGDIGITQSKTFQVTYNEAEFRADVRRRFPGTTAELATGYFSGNYSITGSILAPAPRGC